MPPGPDIGPAPAYLQQQEIPKRYAGQYAPADARAKEQVGERLNSIVCAARYEWELVRSLLKERKAVADRPPAEIPPECKLENEKPEKVQRRRRALAKG